MKSTSRRKQAIVVGQGVVLVSRGKKVRSAIRLKEPGQTEPGKMATRLKPVDGDADAYALPG